MTPRGGMVTFQSESARRKLLWAGAVSLTVVLLLQLALSVRQESQTWDEADHIFAGYIHWTRGDLGVNPEHPPLVKLLATAPLLRLPLHVPPLGSGYFKSAAFLAGRDFLYSNDADMILFRVRMAVSILTALLALLVFAAVQEMFGAGAAFAAMILFVFEPNILAHGALVATDMGAACFLFATLYAFYRYVKRPTIARLLLAGCAAGLGLAAKHSGILIFPILILLAFTEVVRRPQVPIEPGNKAGSRGWQALRLAGALVVVGVLAVAILWSFYGFRFQIRPAGLSISPTLAEYAGQLKNPAERRTILALARWRLLPEAYLYGLTDVKVVADATPSYLFGKVYRQGQWFYFPAVLVIKSTLPVILLLLLLPMAMALRRAPGRREILFLTVPPAFYFAVAMFSGLNIGVRHILPIYPFVVVLAAVTAWMLVRHHGRWSYVVAMLLLFHIVSSARAFPTYLAYSNEIWGGPANTYKFLTDSNTDWGQQLKATRRYLDQRGVKNCWFAYFAAVVADPSYYGIPCKPLTTIASLWLQPALDVPPSIDGPVLVSAGTLSGYEIGPGELNPYAQFQKIRPTAYIADGIFVFDGHFDIPLASALNHVTLASRLSSRNQLGQALAEAQMAVALAPNSVRAQAALGNILRQMKRTEEARQAFQRALTLAQTVEPDFQRRWIPILQKAAAGSR